MEKLGAGQAAGLAMWNGGGSAGAGWARPASDLRRAVAAAMPSPLALLVYFGAYVAAGGFGQGLAIIPGVSITFWPPAGIFVGTLLLFPRASWAWWIAVGCLAELACNALWFGNPLRFALVYFSANALTALAAATLVTRWLGRPFRMETLEEVTAFAVLGAGLAPMASATVIASTDWLIGKHAFLTAWPLVWLGDGSGLMISTPLTVAAVLAWRERESTPWRRAAEVAAIAGAIVAIVGLAHRGLLPSPYVALPVLLWAALRFQLRGAAAALGLLAVAMAYATVAGRGEFAGAPETVQRRIIELKTFLAIAAVSTLLVAALARQYRDALGALRAGNALLERRVEERTAALASSERRMSAILDALPLGVGLADTTRTVTVANQVFRRHIPKAVPSADEQRFALWEARDAEGRLLDRENYPAVRALRGERVWPGQEFLYRGDEARGPMWLRVAALPFRGGQGEILGATIVLDDIDAEKRAGDALKASEERLRMAQEAAELGSWDHDFATGAAIWSDEALRLLGVGADEPASTELLLSRIHPEDRDAARAAMAEAMAEGGSGRYRAEYRVVLPDGAIRWMEAQGRVERQHPGDPGRAHGVVRDVSERVLHEQRADLLMREVNHRSKNMLSLVQAIARQTVADEPKDFARRFEQRVIALSASQDLLIGSGWKGVDMAELVRAQLAHFDDQLGVRIVAEGPPVTVNPAAAQTLGLALHELSTNAGKYGALSNGEGVVTIRWSLTGEGRAARRFAVSWAERGGPRIVATGRKGFGTAVISRMSRLSLDADVRFDLAPDGLVWRLECEASRVLENAGEPIPDSAGDHRDDMPSGG